ILAELMQGPDNTYVAAGSVSSVSTGDWVHLTVVREGVNLRFYVNGALTQESAAEAVTDLVEGVAAFRLGGTHLPAFMRSFAGDADDLRLYHGALDATQIEALADVACE